MIRPTTRFIQVRQAETVAAGLNQVTASTAGQQTLEGGPLLAGDLEALQQLAGRRRMVDLVADQLQQLFAD